MPIGSVGVYYRQMTQEQRAGSVAVANEEAVRAWNTVLYERWKLNRKVFVGALAEVTEDVFELFPPPNAGAASTSGAALARRLSSWLSSSDR